MENNNYGLSGFTEDAHDEFLGFGKKARRKRKDRRARKKEKRAIRFERRRLKNDARRADNESKRAETNLMSNTLSPSNVGLMNGAPIENITRQTPAVTTPSNQPAQVQKAGISNPQPQQAGFGNNTIMIVVGVLLVGGFLLNRQKQNGVMMQPAGLPAPN